MDDAERAEIRRRLEGMLEEVQREQAERAARAQPLELDECIGQQTRVELLQAYHFDVATRRRDATRVQQLRAALRALDAGEYGVCRLCGEAIEARRLALVPQTLVCVACQREREVG